MKSLTAVLHARVAEAEIRKTATGKDYLSIKAELLDEAKAEKCGPIWVTSFHKSHITAGLHPGMRIRVEGALDVQRYEKDGEKRVSLRLTADDLTIMVEAAPKCETQKPAPPANSMACVRASISATLNGTQDWSAIDVFEPKNKPKLPPEKIAELSMPAAKNSGKRHERPFDDALPF